MAASLSTSRTPTCWTNWGSRIDVHAWGENVVTAGDGDLQFAGGNEDFWYTSVFGQPPVASFTFACTDLSGTFNGSGSTDNVGIVSYAWSFGDAASGSGVTTSHTYAARGTYTATLTVTATHGFTHAKSLTVTVALPRDAQILSQSVPATMVAGETYPVSVTLKNVGTLGGLTPPLLLLPYATPWPPLLHCS